MSARHGSRTAACISAAVVVSLTCLASGAAPTVPSDEAAVVHTLERLTFGATPGAIDRARRMGLKEWIDEQLRPSQIDDREMAQRLAPFETLGLSIEELAREYIIPARRERMERRQNEAARPPSAAFEPSAASVASAASEPSAPSVAPPLSAAPEGARRKEQSIVAELSQAKILRAVYSERQLEEVLVDFWFNHFNVFAGKGQTRGFVTAYDRDTIRPHVLGRFRDLLGATATSPAMLFYLDNWMSRAPAGAPTLSDTTRAGRGFRRPGRLPRLRMPTEPASTPTPKPAARAMRGLNENYARELLELHTLGVDGGYTQKDIVEVARAFTGWTLDRQDSGGVRFVPGMHDAGAKLVLGREIPAGGGERDKDRVLDILAAHPSTARFIATKLARRFVSDQPPAALVDRAAARFTQTKGDLREVVRFIVTSPEFFASETRAAKVKTPLEFVVSALRVTSADVESAMPLVRALGQLGMPVYQCQPPTGYDDTADTWVSSGALVTRMNFALELASGRLRGTGIRGLDSGTIDELRASLERSVLHGRASASTVATMARATTREQTIALAIGSPEFQRR